MAENPVLNHEQMQTWKKNGYLVLPSFFSTKEVAQLAGWAEEIRDWPSVEGQHLNYYELVDGKKTLSRTENFLPFHPGFRQLIQESRLFGMLEEIVGEPVLLFKEKINYKYPGTGCYAPHQDIHAFDTSPLAFQHYHINAALFLDEATLENGCFEVVPGFEGKVLDRNPNGSIVEEIAGSLDWIPVNATPGTVLIFNCYVPHRSALNTSIKPRRTVYFTFNGVSKGDLREAHYKDRASGKGKTREINSALFIDKPTATPPK